MVIYAKIPRPCALCYCIRYITLQACRDRQTKDARIPFFHSSGSRGAIVFSLYRLNTVYGNIGPYTAAKLLLFALISMSGRSPDANDNNCIL